MTGDSSLSAETSTLLYDMCAFYEGWLRLIRDSQVRGCFCWRCGSGTRHFRGGGPVITHWVSLVRLRGAGAAAALRRPHIARPPRCPLHIRPTQVSTRVSHPAGSLGDTTPLTFGNYPADPAWGTALPSVLQAHWRACGDAAVVSANYAASAAWVNFLQGQANSTGLARLYSHCAWEAAQRGRLCGCACGA